MKVQCDVCKRGEAMVLCCADEAALCSNCDADIHAANKLAARHQRVPLYRSKSYMPTCDICQEKSGYFFCLEDRALLCRQCDVGVHTANPHVSEHHRFLITGVQVGLQQCTTTVVSGNNYSGSSNVVGNNNSSNNIYDVITNNTVNSNNGESDNIKGNGCNPSSSEVVSATSPSPEMNVEGQWQWSEILGSSEFEQCYEGFSDFGFSSVADDH